MTGYTMVLTQSTGTTSAQPNACRILSTTSGFLRAPVPEVHRSRTAKSSRSNTSLVARVLTAASQVVPPRPRPHLASGGHRRLEWSHAGSTMRLSGVCYRPAAPTWSVASASAAWSGFATFTELRALAPTTPFLFLSDSDDERHGLEAVRAGAQDVLVNSELDGERLARALRHAIERNRLHAALLDLALVDDLTGLYNRRGFLTLATRDLRVARRGGETLPVAFGGRDDVRRVNDSAGHAVGDRALRDTAALLRRTFRDSDLVARIGGDEYAVLVRHAGHASAEVLAERMKRQVREFNRRAGRPYQLSISLGFATHKASTLDSVAGLLDRADRALSRDERSHRDQA